MNKEKINDILGTFLLANIPEIITQEEFDDVKSAIKELQKKAKLGETYKKLYGEVKKQKDDVIEYIKYQLSNFDFEKDEDLKAKMLGSMILIMLEKDERKD